MRVHCVPSRRAKDEGAPIEEQIIHPDLVREQNGDVQSRLDQTARSMRCEGLPA